MPPGSFLSTHAQQRLNKTIARLSDEHSRFIGFPAALDYNVSELAPFWQLFLNNLGDPYVDPLLSLHTREFEREVIDYFAELFHAPAGGYWGYVSGGSTECILYALYTARERLPGARLYYSAAAHYGVPKNARLLKLPATVVQTQPSGEMDYAHLERLLRRRKGKPAIVLATVGTTMTEARDNVATIKQLLQTYAPQHHIHTDAALAGIYTALLEPHWPFDFSDGADSINVSGHKFVGSPMPSGVVIMRKEILAGGKSNYTGTPDTTISGSRNGHTPLLLWYAIQRWGREGFRQRAQAGLELAAYTHQRLEALGWPAWRNPQALTVVLAAPSEALARKWQLATADGWSHVICMPGVTREKIDNFLADLEATLHKNEPQPAILTTMALVASGSNNSSGGMAARSNRS